MVRVHLDFESRSKADIWSCGAYKYSQDPSTEVLCLAYTVDDSPVKVIKVWEINEIDLQTPEAQMYDVCFADYGPDTEELFDLAKNPDAIFVAHNAYFEQCIWKNIIEKRFGFPEIPIHRWECTAAKSLAHGLPKSLKEVAHVLGLAEQKDEEGKRIMMKMCKPRKPTKNDPSEWCEAPEDFEVLYKYCAQDVEVERAIDKALPDLNNTEQRVWQLDQEMNMNGIRVDMELVDKALEFAVEYSDKLNKRLFDITDGMVDKHSKRLAFLRWLELNGVALPDFTASTVRKAISEGSKLPKLVLEALKIKMSLAKSSVTKYKAFKESTCEDGRLRDILVYHSASTGRWGGKIVQLQNLPRGNEKYTDACAACIKKLSLADFEKLYPDVMGALSSCIRSVLLPDEDAALFVADYNSIEARVLAGLAGQQDTLDVFNNGDCVYCKEAAGIFGRKITKKEKFERQVGKVATLALGYQGGIGAFGTMANAYALDLDPVYDIMFPSFSQQEFDSAEWAYNFYQSKVENPLSKKGGIVADVIKQRWRANNSAIVAYWNACENAAVAAVSFLGMEYKVGAVTFIRPVDSQFLYCELPSGRRLAYHKPEIRTQGNREQLTYMTLLSQTKKYVRTSAYGGKLVENITQAVARDIMADAMLSVKKYGIFVPHLTVHDEIITSGPLNQDVKELEREMCLTPAWAKNLPIAAEGWRGVRYRKA